MFDPSIATQAVRRSLADEAELAARHADPRTTTIYDRRRENFDRHAAYVVVAFIAGPDRPAPG
jgi:hypothetical protein